MRALTPVTVMAAALLLGIAMAAVALWLALSRPVVDLPPGAVPVSVAQIALTPTDLIEEPDQLPGYAAMADFFERQTRLAAALEAPQVRIGYALPDGTTGERVFETRPRGLADLPLPFWFQIAVGVIALLIGAWVFALRRYDWGARMFALTGICVPVFAMAAAVYSTRPIALDGETFRLLSGINHAGAGTFGIGLVGLFLMYPTRLVRPIWLLVPVAVFGGAMVADALRLAPDGTAGLITLTEMLVAIVLAGVQWWRTRREPLDRAGLRWFMLFTVVGCSLFIFLSVVPPLLGFAEEGLISQGYAFGFFLVMHVGLALGLLRYRVFELDEWAHRVWLWLAALALVIAVDLGVLRALQVQPWASFSVALLIVGFLYFPLRQVVLGRLFRNRRPTLEGRLSGVMGAAFAPDAAERDAAWETVLRETFDPLGDVEPLTEDLTRARIEEQGLALAVPGAGGIGARRLRYARRGRRLFSRDDAAVADGLAQMLAVALDGRDSYERGVTVERTRISRDVHDNLGAQLLSALQAPDGARKDALLRDTLADLRGIVNEGFQRNQRLGDVLADLRIETADRLEAAGIALDWPLDAAPPEDRALALPAVGALRAILREAVSNVVRHSGARRVSVGVGIDGETLHARIRDDGGGIGAGPGGSGLRNMRGRAADLGGRLDIDSGAEGTTIDLALPLAPAADAARCAS